MKKEDVLDLVRVGYQLAWESGSILMGIGKFDDWSTSQTNRESWLFHQIFLVMAVMSPVPATPQISFQYLGAPRLIKSCSPEIVEEPVQLPRITEDIIYVAVGEIVKESTSTLLWALQNSGGKRIGILHVHQPSKTIPMSKSNAYKFTNYFF